MTALLIVTALLLLLGAAALVPERLAHPVRVTAIVLAPACAIGVCVAVRSFRGWPLPVGSPPAGAVFVAAEVDQPKQIFLLLNPRGAHSPRLYRIAYSDRLYAQVLQAEQQTRQGGVVTVQKAHRTGAGLPPPGPHMPRFDLRRYVGPPARPPQKSP